MNDLKTPDFSRLAPPAGSRLLAIGGCGGIGFAFVQQARALGLSVTVMDLRQAAARREMEHHPDFVAIDLRDESSINDAFASLARSRVRFDSIAICSGYTKGFDQVADLDTERFDDVLSGNLRGPVLALRAANQVLAENASMVLLSTAIGQIGAPGYAGYGAAKAGLNAIIRILAAELAPRVRVNGVAPGAVDTAFIRGGYSEGGGEVGAPSRFDEDAYNAKIPMHRMAVADDVVGPMLFMLSDSARYITGQVLHVNGGGLMRD